MNEKNFDEMLDLICQHLDTSLEGETAFTMLLGAGFSYGVIPTAKDVLEAAPAWLAKRTERGGNEDEVVSAADISKKFWKNIADNYNDKNFWEKNTDKHEDVVLEFDKTTGLLENKHISRAYKHLMSSVYPTGLTTPKIRREFMREICSNANRKNNPSHLYLACLLNQQRKAGWKYNAKFCKTILTTNFDHLLQDALQLVNVLYYMSDRPEAFEFLQEDDHNAIHLVYTHGSVHRYILLNSKEEIKGAAEKNSSALKSHFEQHGVIVMGYGGWEDSTMTALLQANRFDGNLYWCVRKGEDISDNVKELLEKHAACAFKVTIPSADEAMHKIFERLSCSETPELLQDPINMLIEQMDGLSFAETKPKDMSDKPEFIHSFNSQIKNSLSQLKIAREAFLNPEKYEEGGAGAPELIANDGKVGVSETVKKEAVASKYISEAFNLTKTGKFDTAIDLWNKIIDMPEISTEQKADSLINRGVAHGKLEPQKNEEELADYTTVIEMMEVPPDLKARALFYRGITYGGLESPRHEDSIVDYTAIIEMADASPTQKARALNNRSLAKCKLIPPKFEEAIADCDTVIEMADISAVQKARALCNRGVTFGRLSPPKTQEEIADYTSVIEMADILETQKARSLNNRGVAYKSLEPPKIEEAIIDHTTVIEMKDVPLTQKVSALHGRCLAYSKLSPAKIDEIIVDYTMIVDMPDVSLNDKAKALNLRGHTYSEFEPPKSEELIADYTSVIKIEGVLDLHKSNAHGNLGFFQFKLNNDVQSLLRESLNALKYEGECYAWRYNLGLARLFIGEPVKALEHCVPAIDDCTTAGSIEVALDLLEMKTDILPDESKNAYDKIVAKLKERKEEIEAGD